ncbi:MAG: hypothetical protein HON51_11855 [Gammaproteobacteria bacterium]|nr:hypothetical protein [Gammaproteobacteria bacterium]MBT5222118.1 hypothetical protein [Gammaproteobacteria bacterium]MBT5825605.1 hypothetical protein [Gammaproteobacteria bacterium]MBT5967367.1 hypothetical protein [Gammaproteobacteria bacterium]MBT6420880.1 hypothetical protein [Gammaproteobacteria bacterium]
MRVILILMLSVFMGSVAAITRCELNGKVYYQTAACPKHSKVQYLVNDKYIDEDKLRKYRQEKEDTMPEEQLSVSEEKPKQVTDSSALSDAGAQVDDELDKQAVKNAPHVNVPSTFDYVNPKLSDMQRKLDEHNKELHKLQNAQ